MRVRQLTVLAMGGLLLLAGCGDREETAEEAASNDKIFAYVLSEYPGKSWGGTPEQLGKSGRAICAYFDEGGNAMDIVAGRMNNGETQAAAEFYVKTAQSVFCG